MAEIYRQGVESGNATFGEEVPSWECWDRGHLEDCRLVAEIDGRIASWAALSPVSGRAVYAGVAEASVYVGNEHRGKGMGSLLMQRLIESSESSGIWTLQASVFRENLASIMLHESQGFRLVGYRERIRG